MLQGDPAAVSYWMMRNVPLSAAARLKLLGAPTAAHRLRSLCTILTAEARSHLLCAVCRCQVTPDAALPGPEPACQVSCARASGESGCDVQGPASLLLQGQPPVALGPVADTWESGSLTTGAGTATMR